MRYLSPYRKLTPHSGVGAWTPASLTGIVAWYNFGDSGSLTASGGAISQINDLSGNAHHATQATGSKQPTVQSAALNGKNTARFTSAAQTNLAIASPPTASGDITLWAVVKRTGSILNVVGNPTGYPFEVYSNNSLYSSTGGKTVTVGAPGIAINDAYHTIVIRTKGDGSAYDVTVDGVSQTITGAVPGTINLLSYIGHGDSAYSDMDLAECGVAASYLSTTDFNDLDGWFNSQWGL